VTINPTTAIVVVVITHAMAVGLGGLLVWALAQRELAKLRGKMVKTLDMADDTYARAEAGRLLEAGTDKTKSTLDLLAEEGHEPIDPADLAAD